MDTFTPPRAPSAPKRSAVGRLLKWAAIAVAVLAALAVIVIGFAFWATSGAVEAADTFFEQVTEGQLKTAYEGTAGIFKDATSEEEWNAFIAEREMLSQIDSVSFSSREVSGDRASLEGMLKIQDGSKMPVSVQLIHENNAWRVAGFELNPEME